MRLTRHCRDTSVALISHLLEGQLQGLKNAPLAAFEGVGRATPALTRQSHLEGLQAPRMAASDGGATA